MVVFPVFVIPNDAPPRPPHSCAPLSENKMDKFRAIRYFLKVAELSSFSLAARTLSVPVSSVSRRIRDLEADLQVELFHRSTRVVKLTELGEAYYQRVRHVISSLDDADEFITQRAQVPAGVLKISTSPGYATQVLNPVLEKFTQLYPNIILDMDLSDQLTDIAQGEVDLAIRCTGDLPDRVVARRISDNDFALVAAPSYIQEHGTPSTVEELRAHRTLLYRGFDGIRHWQIRHNDHWKELQTQPVFISSDGMSLLNGALQGSGLALLPKWGIHTQLERGELQEITLEEGTLSVSRVPESAVYLLYLRPRYHILKIKVAVDFILAELAEPDH